MILWLINLSANFKLLLSTVLIQEKSICLKAETKININNIMTFYVMIHYIIQFPVPDRMTDTKNLLLKITEAVVQCYCKSRAQLMLMRNYHKHALLTFLVMIKMVCNLALNLAVILIINFFHLFTTIRNLLLSIYVGMYLHFLWRLCWKVYR